MTPKDFIFNLTVPADADGAAVVAVVAAHAVEYAGIEVAAGAAFVERVRAAAGTGADGRRGADGMPGRRCGR